MQSDWQAATVGAVSLVVTKGTTPTTLGHAFQDAGINFVKVESISPDGRFLVDKLVRISKEAHEALARSKLAPNDVLFTIAGTIGRTAIVTDEILPANTNQAVAIVRPNTALVHPRFLRYVLSNPAFLRGALSRTVESVQANFSLGELKSASILLPNLREQQVITEILGAIDDRIDHLRQTNATIESIAHALFKSWFIDFDPVRAKAESREPEGMDAATAALFPAEFEESALGLIPRGWTVRSLDSFATYLNGLALQKYPAESEDEYLPVIKIAQLRAGHTNGSDRASARLKPEYVVGDGDVLFSWSGSLEVEFWCGGEGALNQHLFKVTSSEVPKWFYYLATKHFLPGFREIAAHKATTMGHIQRGHLTASRLALPPAPAIRALSSVMGPLLERRINGALQARELAAVRDSLLPRLICGRLRLPEAMEAAEAAVA